MINPLQGEIIKKLEYLSEISLQEVLKFIDFLEFKNQKLEQLSSLEPKDSSHLLFKPNNAITYYQLGKVQLQLLEYQKAIQEFSQALQMNPNFAEAYYYRGKSYHKLNDKQRAIADFQTSAKIVCEHNQSEKMASWTPFELGESNREEAIKHLLPYLSSANSYDDRRLAASAINKLANSFKKSCELAIPHLLENLSEPAPQLRQYTLKALSVISLPNYALSQIQAIAENDPKDYNRKIAKTLLNRSS
ncbi:tetratricopeptide repeat protein [Nostocaceae cyanobacterium CENA369]|uniref:Tetratricopeptide repeat protein n=1 Tax=Dendronalium phyllosphericum CENA369 TaxID=1725256 RepID=A0A8J7I017_9NOST|nr:tetratricopeptide repeat protein [Dendronalium phyllosphericum]MBH8572230.1 tetratricopeptide repeat protein [Dendronalium phyllosphericum CENA369]